MAPPIKETTTLIVNRKLLTSPDSMIDLGPKPSLPNSLMKKMLPKTPEIVLPVKPIVYLFLSMANKLEPNRPIKILMSAINVSVMTKLF